MTESNTKKVNKPVLLSAAAVACLVVLGIGFWMGTHPSAEPLYGVMQAKTVDVAAKVTGRVETLPVHEGDSVSAGQLLMTLDIPEVEAKLKEVEALKSAATARQSLVDEGARPQEIRAAKAQMQRAQAGQELAQKTFNRVHALYREGLISKQKHDEALAQKKSADELLAAAKEQYDIALTGARTQEKQAATALTAQATGGVEQVESLVKEKNVTSPIASEISRIYVEIGEVAAAGLPLATLVDLSDQWAVFNIREDDMPKITKGAVLSAEIPALNAKNVQFKVYFINPRGDYATWRATRQSSGYDLRTFEVRARPVQPVSDLRPGMSVIVNR
ncbi:efflux RND transporter periplasmic adaptor subunit [Parasutterella secunda]|uniref:HlyD family secretion protein n=1 Tax=Parasutterella secunda TaxID=626947 RepID=UPI00201259DD|nr:efflux RND transporter periplasmic adaptor subunit [Parasutterella secunda]MCL1596882.1 efflux RND transporter periplasmic adaptor subunit [Parasutterella secunda]